LEKRRHVFDIQLNAISDSDNPTKKDCTFILHGFDISHNHAFISKETAEETLHTLKGMPIVARYFPKSNHELEDDALGSHEMYLERDRATGEAIVSMDTVPIGVFTDNAYITTVTDENGNEKEVVAGDGILWASRFPNVVGLLKEWVDEGISVVSSMEILYDSYKVDEGITEILNYVYEGHCILNSEDRGNHKKVYPAYDESKLTKLVAEAIDQENIIKQQNSNEEGEKMEIFKKVFELSHEDIRSLLYSDLDPKLGDRTYAYIVEVYDNSFVANVYSYAEGNEYDKFFKFEYNKGEDKVEVNAESKKEVFLKRNWEEIVPEDIQTQLNEKDTKIDELEVQLNSVKEEKEGIQTQFNETTEKLVQLNSVVEELQPYKDQVEQEKLEKALNEKKEFYSAKFSALKASEKFDTEEVQELVKKTVFDNEDGKEAILQLNTMLVELVTVEVKQEEDTVIREVSSKREKLIPANNDFDSKYSL
jgi:chaperonin cofactor prefoldin